MVSFIVGRSLQALATLVLVSFLVFAASSLTGDPVSLLLPLDASAEQVADLRSSLGLDRPLHIQYATYMGKLIQGDLGRSIRGGHPVADLVGPATINSALLGAVAMLLVVAVGVPAGVIAAIRRGTWADKSIRFVAVVAQSIPGFWLAIVLIQVFGVQLGVLPVLGMDSPAHYVLPAITLAFGGVVLAAFVRLLRSSILEEIGQQYVTAAHAKGLGPRTVMRRHVLRNALLPVLTFGGMSFGMLVSGSIVVESVFAWPGLGSLTFDAISARDFPVIQAVTLVAAAFVVVVSFIVDVLYGVVDPRVRVRG